MKEYADPRMHSAEHILNQTMVRMFNSGRCFRAHIEKKKSKARFFPEARLNVVETFLSTRGEGPALIEAGEDGRRATLSWDDLRAQVAAMAAALTEAGVGPGDRVAAWLPNVAETIVTMLATAAVGATFSSTSPDFGTAGVLVGMFLFGILYRWWYRRYGEGAESDDGIRRAVYVVLLTMCWNIEGGIASMLAGALKMLLLVSIFTIVTRRLGLLVPIDPVAGLHI